MPREKKSVTTLCLGVRKKNVQNRQLFRIFDESFGFEMKKVYVCFICTHLNIFDLLTELNRIPLILYSLLRFASSRISFSWNWKNTFLSQFGPTLVCISLKIKIVIWTFSKHTKSVEYYPIEAATHKYKHLTVIAKEIRLNEYFEPRSSNWSESISPNIRGEISAHNFLHKMCSIYLENEWARLTHTLFYYYYIARIPMCYK